MPITGVIPSALMTGLPAIDREHETLMASLRLLEREPMANARSERFLEIVSQLGQQIFQHFDAEEAILKDSSMPAADVAEHIRAHNNILEQYAELQQDLMLGKTLEQSGVLAMIERWIVNHVVTHDLKMKEHFAG